MILGHLCVHGQFCEVYVTRKVWVLEWEDFFKWDLEKDFWKNIYLLVSVWMAELQKMKEWERERASFHVSPLSLLKWPQWLELDWSETGSHKLPLGYTHGCRDAAWSILCCFPRYTSGELDLDWSSQDWSWQPYGMPVLRSISMRCPLKTLGSGHFSP